MGVGPSYDFHTDYVEFIITAIEDYTFHLKLFHTTRSACKSFIKSINMTQMRQHGLNVNHIFIGPRSDHSLPMSLTDSLTHSLTDKLVED